MSPRQLIDVCGYCGLPDGHSRRCSVTKWGVPELREPKDELKTYDERGSDDERVRQLEGQNDYLRQVAGWMALELDDTADAIDPVPDLVEKALRSYVTKLWAVARGEYPDCGPFGPTL